MFLLDTNILSDLIRHPQGVIASRIADVGEAEIATSIIVAGQLRYGAERRGSLLTAQLETVLELLPTLALGDDADIPYQRLRNDIERREPPIIGANDMLIAAHALSLGATLVTDNVQEFACVTDLTIANWLRDA